MGRTVAVAWHATFSLAAGVLYFFFVLPRWWELIGETPFTLGLALRIVAGALIGLAALPVVFTLLRTRRPELGTPRLALRLRLSSIVLHVLAGALIIGTAISELWFSLDDAGRWLFGIYGAAAAVGLLAIFTFYLAFVAELPPPPPKPLKPKTPRRRRGRKKGEETDETSEASETEETDAADETDESPETPGSEETDGPDDEGEPTEDPEPSTEVTAEGETAEQDPPDGKLRNRRPGTKAVTLRRRRRTRGGVAVED